MPATTGAYLEPDSAFDPIKADYPSCPDATNLLFDPAPGITTGTASLEENTDNPKRLVTVRADGVANNKIHRYDIQFAPFAISDYRNHLDLNAVIPSSGDPVKVKISCQTLGAFNVIRID
jgi:hypothetical protein